MKLCKTSQSLRKALSSASRPIVLVPTMGALHDGHEALVRRAWKEAGDGTVVVSIFVNPTQFGPNEDFEKYPKTLHDDLVRCERAGAGWVFVPDVAEMYSPGESVTVEESRLSGSLCGRSRPGHFRGVCMIVTKLFHLVQPDAAVFGEKDWQQLAIIRRMVRDLKFPITILAHPTLREGDGLAMSSRNAYLDAAERAAAPGIYRAMNAALAQGGSPDDIAAEARRGIAGLPGAKIDYVEVVDAETLTPVTDRSQPARLAVALFLGSTRLIDNISIPEL